MEKHEIWKELKSVRTQIEGLLQSVDALVVEVGIEVEQDEMDLDWKGPGGRPDGCPASSLKDQGRS